MKAESARARKKNVLEDMRFYSAPFLLVALLSISGKEQDSEKTIKATEQVSIAVVLKCLCAYRDGNRR